MLVFGGVIESELKKIHFIMSRSDPAIMIHHAPVVAINMPTPLGPLN